MTDVIMQAARNVVRANRSVRELNTLDRLQALTPDKLLDHMKETDAAYDALDIALEMLERAMEGQ